MRQIRCVPLLLLVLAYLLSGCNNERRSGMRLTMLCEGGQPETSGTRGVSFVFKAETATGEPITDLDVSDWYDVQDGGNSTGFESRAAAVRRPQNMALRTLVLLDGSESLLGQEAAIKAAVEQFITRSFEGVGSQETRQIAIYKFYGRNEITRIHDFSSDRNSLITALRANAYVLPDTTTALYDATRLAIEELSRDPSYPEGTPHPAILARTLVVFTDGRDEAYSGSQAATARSATVAAATSFKRSTDNTILVAGVDRRDGLLDDSFLSTIASPTGYVKESELTNLGALFTRFAQISGDKTKKYYQFNFCTNRRRQVVNATMVVSPPENYAEGRLPFQYDATSFDDGACDVANLPTCSWGTVEEMPNPEPSPSPSVTPRPGVLSRTIGAPGHMASAVEVGSDSADNVYVLGNFDGVVDFGGTSLMHDVGTLGFYNVGHYLAKYARDGALLWVVKLSGMGPINSSSKSMAVQANGDVVLASDSFVSTTEQSALRLIKIAGASGAELWTRDLRYDDGSTGAAFKLNSLAVGATGDIFVVGTVNRVLNHGGYIFSLFDPTIEPSVAIFKFAPNGAVQSAVGAYANSETDGITSFDIAVHSEGGIDHVYLAGTFSGELSLDSDLGGSPAYLYTSERRSGFVARYQSSQSSNELNLVSATKVYEPENGIIHSVSADTNGPIVAALTDYTFEESVGMNTAGVIRLARINEIGERTWNYAYGSPSTLSWVNSMVIDHNSRPHACANYGGVFDTELGFLTAFRAAVFYITPGSEDLNLVNDATSVVGSGDIPPTSQCFGITKLSDGTSIVGGSYIGEMTWGEQTFPMDAYGYPKAYLLEIRD